MSTSRLEAFSDGVIAVAITLLVLNIGVPDLQHGETLAHGLAQNWPSYAASIAASRASPPTRSPPRWPPLVVPDAGHLRSAGRLYALTIASGGTASS